MTALLARSALPTLARLSLPLGALQMVTALWASNAIKSDSSVLASPFLVAWTPTAPGTRFAVPAASVPLWSKGARCQQTVMLDRLVTPTRFAWCRPLSVKSTRTAILVRSATLRPGHARTLAQSLVETIMIVPVETAVIASTRSVSQPLLYLAAQIRIAAQARSATSAHACV